MHAIGVLGEALLAHEVATVAAVLWHVVQAELACTLVLIAELIVVAIAIGIAQGCRGAPVVVYSPCHGQDIVVLPEVVCSAVPQASVHLGIAFCLPCRGVVPVLYETLVQAVVSAQSHAVEVLVGLHSAIGIQAVVIVACRHSVPGLAGTFKVAQVPVFQHQATVLAQPCHTCRVTSALAMRAVQITVGSGLMIGSVHHPMLAQQTRGELASRAPCVVTAVTSRHLQHGLHLRQLRLHGNAASEGTVARRAAAHAALYLHASQQGGIGIHVGPEDALVFGRIERHAVQSDVHTASGTATHTHVHRTRAQSVLAPRHHTRGACKQVGQLLPACGELLQLHLADSAHGKGSTLGGTYRLYHNLTQLCHTDRVLLPLLGIGHARHTH